MALQPVSQYNSQLLNPSYGKKNELTKQNGDSAIQRGQSHLSASFYSSDSLSVSFSNKDGDSVSLSMEHVEFGQAQITLDAEHSTEEWQQIVGKIKDEFMQFQGDIIQKFIQSITGSDAPQGAEKRNTSETEPQEIPGLPEYWNAENTSQRIVDFATSFYGIAESTGKDYYDLMRGAIEEGFSQAMGILGELPDAVNNLANTTFELAMQKLDAWAQEQGIDIGEQQAA